MASVSIISFSNNTPANALEVNDNFDNLKSFVESNVVQTDGSVKATTASIANGAVTNEKLNYDTVPQIFVVSAYNAALGKIGDIQVVI